MRVAWVHMGGRAHCRPEISGELLWRPPELIACARESGVVQSEMTSGQLFEVFSFEESLLSVTRLPDLAFQVEDVRAARKELESSGC